MGGYTGARLAPLFSPTPSRITARRMAEHAAEHFHRRMVERTPIDFAGPTPGKTAASWRVKPVIRLVALGEEVYETGVETHDPVARWLEHGTGIYGPHHRPYVIRPRYRGHELRFYSRRLGRWVFARSVLNPGMRAQRPLATAAAITEHELAVVLQVDLEEWVALVEAIGRAEKALHRFR